MFIYRHSYRLFTPSTRLKLSNVLLKPSRHFSQQSQKPPPGTPPSSFSPFRGALYVALATLGFAGYHYILKPQWKDSSKPPKPVVIEQPQQPQEKRTVVFVLGGPGAGKGTQCAKLVKDFGFVHLSAGDLLREERERPGSDYGELINDYIKEGKIVPMEITISLLENAMDKAGSHRFLIDGFPRAMSQALQFEKQVCPGDFVLYFECPEEEMLKRLLKRGETSGRVDDNIESIRKRFRTFTETSFPVIEHYGKLDKVQKISCLNSPDVVYENTRNVFDHHFKQQQQQQA